MINRRTILDIELLDGIGSRSTGQHPHNQGSRTRLPEFLSAPA